MEICKQSTLHAERFKAHLLMIVKLFCNEMEALQRAKKPVPVKPLTIVFFMKSGIEPKSAQELIDGFIAQTHTEWTKIKSKDKHVILDVIPSMLMKDTTDKELSLEDKIVKSYADTIVGYLKNRRTQEDDIFEEEVWSCLEKMVVHCILYVHHYCAPDTNPERRGKYTRKYPVKLSIKQNAAEWDINLFWPTSALVDEAKGK